jgi:activator of HSP90 ATPase
MGTMKQPSTDMFRSSRRHWIVSAVVASGGLVFGPKKAATVADDGLSHTAEAIHQEPIFKASPQRVYDALMDAQQFQKIELLGAATKSRNVTTKPAAISGEAGGAFTLFGGYVVGRQIELIPNQRIVQVWRAMSWPEGAYSIARFEFAAQGGETRLIFDHTRFPAGNGEHLATGWEINYWQPMQKYLG